MQQHYQRVLEIITNNMTPFDAIAVVVFTSLLALGLAWPWFEDQEDAWQD